MSQKSLGIDVTLVHTTVQHTLGLEVEDVVGGQGTLVRVYNTNGIGLTGTSETRNYASNKRYRYIRANTAIAAGDAVKKVLGQTDDPYAFVPTAATVDFGEGIAEVAIPANSYGFITIHGFVKNAKVADAVVAGGFVSPSATAGRLQAHTVVADLTSFQAMIAGIQAITDGSAGNLADVFIHGN